MDETPDRLRLLLVEDEYVLALGMTDALTDLGVEVLGPVASVADALLLIETVPEMGAAILDVNLGSEVVYPVADALLARHTPFFFATANARAQLPERFHDVPLCQKPFEVGEFRRALENLRPVSVAR